MNPKTKTKIWFYLAAIPWLALAIALAIAGLLTLGYVLEYTAYVLGG